MHHIHHKGYAVYTLPMGRTNIDIDDRLIAAVMQRYSLRTKREAVDLAGLQRGVRVPEAVGGSSDVAQRPGLVPVDDLGPDDTDVGDAHPDGRLDETRHRVGVERRVVVHDQEVVRVAHGGDLERGSDRTRQAGPVIERQDAAFAEGLP